MKKQTRRILSLVLALAMLAVSVFAFASCGEEKNYVYVTISDENGNIALAYEKVELEEEMTIDAALRAALARFISNYAVYITAYVSRRGWKR